MRDCAIPSAEKVGWKSRVHTVRTVCTNVWGLRSMRPPSRWWGTESRWRNDRSFLEGSFVRTASCANSGKYAGSTWLRDNSQGAGARPREGRAVRRRPRGPPRDAAGAISIAVPACPFSKWRGEGMVEIRMLRSESRLGRRLDVSWCIRRLFLLARKIVEA